MSVYRNMQGSVVLLVDHQQRIALQLRENRPGLPAANQWGIFGGLMEPDEQPHTAALREIHEELNVRLNPDLLTLHQRHYIPDQNLTTWVYVYPVTDELDNAVLREGQAWDFIGPDDPRAKEIGLHHHEIVHNFWRKSL
jgi:8-oxo-dGTP pyrophosphatase MutT (NUDIX family)